MSWVIRDDDDQNGRTWLADWSVDERGNVDAAWASTMDEALPIDNLNVARLVSASAGGRPMRRVSRLRKALEKVSECSLCNVCAAVAEQALRVPSPSPEQPK